MEIGYPALWEHVNMFLNGMNEQKSGYLLFRSDIIHGRFSKAKLSRFLQGKEHDEKPNLYPDGSDSHLVRKLWGTAKRIQAEII